MRRRLAMWTVSAALALTSAPAFAQSADSTAPVLDDGALLKKYVWSTLGMPGLLHATLASTFEHWRGAPPEWGTEASGFSKRWASEFAENALGSTTKYAVARVLHHDPSFSRCTCTGAGARLRHAVISPFVARTRTGRQVFSPATVAGLSAETIVPATTWYPEPHGFRDGLAHDASGIASKIAVDVLREFVRAPRWLRRP